MGRAAEGCENGAVEFHCVRNKRRHIITHDQMAVNSVPEQVVMSSMPDISCRRDKIKRLASPTMFCSFSIRRKFIMHQSPIEEKYA